MVFGGWLQLHGLKKEEKGTRRFFGRWRHWRLAAYMNGYLCLRKFVTGLYISAYISYYALAGRDSARRLNLLFVSIEAPISKLPDPSKFVFLFPWRHFAGQRSCKTLTHRLPRRVQISICLGLDDEKWADINHGSAERAASDGNLVQVVNWSLQGATTKDGRSYLYIRPVLAIWTSSTVERKR